jgi:hypothetical protein
MKKALITGVTGQDGSYLSEFLLEKGYDVHGIIRRSSVDFRERIAHLEGNPHFHLHYGDLADSMSLLKVISAVRPDEILAENMVNMVHAGSVIVSGSGRAVVTAIGKYTYLGAMTGGIAEIPSRELPKGLSHLKKEFSKIGMLLLVLTLPFCISSFLFGSFPGGNVSLSEAVLVALSIGATAMLSRASNLFCGFFVRYIRKSAVSENPCIIRSLEAFDALADIDYLFLLDGSIATDGILHFDTVATADGETGSFG